VSQVDDELLEDVEDSDEDSEEEDSEEEEEDEEEEDEDEEDEEDTDEDMVWWSESVWEFEGMRGGVDWLGETS